MRYLVLTDIHANLEALDACLDDARRRGFDATLVLGDVVGYGADPNAVIERVLALKPAAIVRGNHDKIALGPGEADTFNAAAKSAALWTLETLTTEHRAWLAALPMGPVRVDDFIEICHGTPYDEDEYIFDELDGLRAMHASTRPLCLFGHTHQPVIFELSNGTFSAGLPASDAETRVLLREDVKYLVNPGSVGQPRDGNPRAAYAIVDTAQRWMDLVRLAYPLEAAQTKVRQAGLPEPLARRLGLGR